MHRFGGPQTRAARPRAVCGIVACVLLLSVSSALPNGTLPEGALNIGYYEVCNPIAAAAQARRALHAMPQSDL